MKNKKILAILTIAATVSVAAAGCSFGGDEPEEQVVVDATPTPEPTSTQDLAVALEQASDLTEGTDFEIQDYTTNTDVEGVGVYSYTVKYTDTTKSGGYTYAIHKIYKSSDEYYNICGSVVDDASYSGIKAAVDSFGILGDSTLKAAAPATSGDNTSADGQTGTTDGTADGTQSGTTDSSSTGDGSSDGTISNSAGFTQEQLTDTNQTRTIYRNSDGHPLVITPDGNGNWVDFDGNTYHIHQFGNINGCGCEFYLHRAVYNLKSLKKTAERLTYTDTAIREGWLCP